VPVRVLAVFGMLVAAFGVFRLAPNAGGEAGHLGGGVLGFLLMKNQHWLSPFAPARRRPASASGASATRRPRRRNAFQKDWSKDMNR